MSECDRCGKDISRGYALDNPTGEIHDHWVCEDCLKDTDEVLDLP